MRYCPGACPCDPPACETVVNVTVTDLCEIAVVEGVTVTLKIAGVPVDSGATNASGFVSLSTVAPNPTAATVTVSGVPTGYATTTVNVTLNCTTISLGIQLLLDPAYTCSEDPCCPQGGDPPYLKPTYPTTLTLTDAFGDVTLSNGGSGTTWTGSAIRPAAAMVRVSDCTYQTGDVTVWFSLARVAGGACWTLTLSANFACSIQIVTGPLFLIKYPGTGATPAVDHAVILSADSHDCDPISGEFTSDFEYTTILGSIFTQDWPYQIYGDVTTFTFSE